MAINWAAAAYDPIKPVAQGNAYANQIFDQAAQRQAGQQYATGDIEGAAGTIARRGDFKTASELKSQGAKLKAGQQYSTGDYGGASKTLAQSGDITGAEGLAQQQAKTFLAQHSLLQKAVPYLNDAVTQGHDPGQAFDVLVPQMKALGTPDDTIAQTRQALVSNPQGVIQALKATAQIDPVFQNVDGTLYVFDKNNPTQPVAKLGDGPKPPSGFERAPNGGLQPIKGGPGDPNYIKQNKENAREIVINNPTPQANQGAFRQLTPEEVQGMGYKPGTRAQINDRTGQINVTQTPNENDLKNAGYANRVAKASQRLDALAKQGITKPTAQILVSEANGVTRLVLSNQKDRQFVQAAKEWLAPILRKDTGAAVTDSEFGYYSDIYIPRPEDGPEVLNQKAAARADAEATLNAESGPARTDMFGKGTPPGQQQPANKTIRFEDLP